MDSENVSLQEQSVQEQEQVTAPQMQTIIEQKTSSDLPGFVELLQNSFSIYKNKFLLLIGIEVLTMLLTFMVFLGSSFFTGIIFLSMQGNGLGFSGVLAFLSTAVVILTSLIQTWGYAASIFVVLHRRESFSLFEVFTKIKPRIMPIWITLLTVVMVVIGGSLFFIVPGVLFALWLSMTEFVQVDENSGIFDALVKSENLTRKNIGFYVSRGLIFIFLLLVIYIMLSTSKFDYRVIYLLQIICVPFTTIFMTLLYEHMREKNKSLSPIGMTNHRKLYKFFIGFGVLVFLIIFFYTFKAIALPMHFLQNR